MKTAIKEYQKNVVLKVIQPTALLLTTFLLSANNALAQSNLITSDAAAETTKNLEHQTNMSYVYMVIGFIVIIGVAWISVIKSKDGSSTSDTHHHPVNHHHHDIHDKRYGTNRAR